RPAVCGGRLVRRFAAGVPPLYPPARVPGDGGAGSPAVRGPSGHPVVAAGPGPVEHLCQAARLVGTGGVDAGRSATVEPVLARRRRLTGEQERGEERR